MLLCRLALRLRPGLRSLRVGDPIPDLSVNVVKETGGKLGVQGGVSAASLFKGKKSVLVGFPGAFTPTCTGTHIPAYIQSLAAFAKKEVQVVGLAVNDAFVLREFHEDLKAGSMTFIADGSGALTRGLDAGVDLTDKALGYRTRRFAAIVVDGTVTAVYDEKGAGMTELSQAESVLKSLE